MKISLYQRKSPYFHFETLQVWECKISYFVKKQLQLFLSGVEGVFRSSAFDILNFRGTKNLVFFYVTGSGVDDQFDKKNRTGRKFIGAGRWKKNFQIQEKWEGQEVNFLSIMGRQLKKFRTFCYLVILIPDKQYPFHQ